MYTCDMCCYHKSMLNNGLMCCLLSSMLLLCAINLTNAIQKGRLMCPSSFSALSGDLHVQLQLDEFNATTTRLLLEKYSTSLLISRLEINQKKLLNTIKIYPDPRNNVTQIAIACQEFLRGGTYFFEIKTNNNSIEDDGQFIFDERLKQKIDVRWPHPNITVTPKTIQTYPENAVKVIVSFPDINCDISRINKTNLPEFWLELYYCGEENICNSLNRTKSTSILYAEQIYGFPKIRVIMLKCILFGLAGHYAIQLRPTENVPSFVTSIEYIRVDWSEKFIFNVHARSIFPCDTHGGLGVLFEYPSCILDQSDRIRLFAKLRADVASLKPPTSLHYITEQRVIKGQHSLYFDCDLFSEKFIEFCFVYVSQALSGAVVDIRMDCVPTLPVSDSDTGGWGAWSDWTPCSSTCSGGTRNRYRFCDSPPPRYGAKFCEGSSVETEQCGSKNADALNCIYAVGISPDKSLINQTGVVEEIGPGCRCGCIVHLGASKPKRIIASTTESCPGRSFWLIQIDGNNNIQMKLNFLRLPCSSQYLKIRNGDSVSSNLILEHIGGYKEKFQPIISTGSQILIEFYSNKTISAGGMCSGGFLAHVQQYSKQTQTGTNAIINTTRTITKKPKTTRQFTIVHITAVIFASIIILISALLGAQYIIRYRKYHLAVNRNNEAESPFHTPRASIGSLHHGPSRAMSTTTLFSEIIYLVKMRPKGAGKHLILRESVDGETILNETNLNTSIVKSNSNDVDSIGSTRTLTNKLMNEQIDSTTFNEKDITDDGSINSVLNDNNSIVTPLPLRKLIKLNGNNVKRENLNCAQQDRTSNIDTDNDSLESFHRNSKFRSVSNATLTNGCYSPAASIISRATIRTTNQKESKDKKNREKLLARPGSEFSLANPEELELDYYDYNVVNASAVPDSFLGMDPAYLVWIPPLDNGNIMEEFKNSHEPDYEEILPNYHDIDTKSNTETPEAPEAPELPPVNLSKSKITPITEENNKNEIIQKTIVQTMLKERSPILINRNLSIQSKNVENIQLKEIAEKIDEHKSQYNNDDNNMSPTGKDNKTEKEIGFIKSPSDLQDYYELDDLQFADDDSSYESEKFFYKTDDKIKT